MTDKKSSKFEYIVNGEIAFNKPVLLKKMHRDVYFSLGREFDNYQFRRFSVTQEQVDHAVEARVKDLRKRYKYIRLWFGGGKDCTLALLSFIKHKVKIDEIVIARRCCKNTMGLYSEFDPLIEIDKSAVEKIKSLQNQLPGTVITILDIDDREFEAVFETPLWYLETTEWFFSVAYLPKIFHKFVNPKLNILSYYTDTCELVGSAIPFVSYSREENLWVFGYNSAGFNPIGPSTELTNFEDFLVTDNDPSLVEFHVNSIIDDYEQTDQLPNYSKNIRQHERSVRDRSLLYKNIVFDEFQFSKNDLEVDFPTDDYFWRAGQSSRTFYEMINRFYQQPMARSLELYIKNANWKLIEQYRKNNGIATKAWKML